MEKELKITVIKSGPLKVEGELKLIMPDGEEKVQNNAFLCRCGGSSKKPSATELTKKSVSKRIKCFRK